MAKKQLKFFFNYPLNVYYFNYNLQINLTQ